ncbi:MAG TPA: sigma-70 family RNA polymerase sigma factor [Nocardioides sp.]|uniref:RNA polymerase sigma factor n=1 Tax=Nocardioides sp. TaxID=35761 RepID=UPI002F3FF4CD
MVAADDQTIAQAKDGDHAAWRALYTAHAGRLLVWLRMFPSGDAGISAEDLASETWLTAAAKIADFRGSTGEFGGWLFGIARRQARNAERRSSRRRTSPATTETLDDLLHPLRAHGADTAPDSDNWIAWLLSHLPAREREVVSCLDVVGLDVASTATALGINASAVRVAHHRALKKLRALGVEVS